MDEANLMNNYCWCQRKVHKMLKNADGEDVLGPLVQVRDSRCWDVLTGRCGRCGLKYRMPLPLPAAQSPHDEQPTQRSRVLDPTEIHNPETDK